MTDPIVRRHCIQSSKIAGLVQIPIRYAESYEKTQRWVLVMAADALVSIVDDDESVRESLPDLVRQFGFATQAFSSAEAFLASEFVDETRCLILDIAMPGMSGPELQRELKSRQKPIPIIFITADGDRSVRSRLLADGGVECLFKPFSDRALLDALTTVFPKS
jgi:FixJ family two-component response regulator